MTEYIEKSELYKEIAELEDYARYIFLSTKGNSTLYLKRMIQLDELTRLKHIIHDFPAADVAEVKHGKWVYWPGWVGNHDKRIDGATCSICGFKHPTVLHVRTPKESLYKNCPECRAKMDLED